MRLLQPQRELWVLEEPPGTPPLLPGSENKLDADGHLKVWVFGEPRTPRESEGTEAAAEVGAAAPTSDVDTTGSASEPELVLPIVELPHATGPGSGDPFGIQPPALAVGYDHPLTLLDQLLTGDPAGGRTTFILPFEPGFFRDLAIATADNLRFITLRPRISDFPPQDPREQAIGRLVGTGILTLGAVFTPGPQDDLALAGGITRSAVRGTPSAYSVAFETTIPKVGAGTRPAHFKAANEALLAEARARPELAQAIRSLGIEVPSTTAGSGCCCTG